MRVPVLLRVGAAVTSSLVVTAMVLTAPLSSAAPANIAGMIVFLDPGHSGTADPAAMGRQVPTGRGGTKNCQTSGTTTNSGYPEHSFAWDTTLRIRQALNSAGVRTAMSRGNDNGPGPCVDERAAMANALHPNAIVSIHADGGPAGARPRPPGTPYPLRIAFRRDQAGEVVVSERLLDPPDESPAPLMRHVSQRRG